MGKRRPCDRRKGIVIDWFTPTIASQDEVLWPRVEVPTVAAVAPAVVAVQLEATCASVIFSVEGVVPTDMAFVAEALACVVVQLEEAHADMLWDAECECNVGLDTKWSCR